MGEKMTAPDRDPFAFEIAGAIIAPQHSKVARYGSIQEKIIQCDNPAPSLCTPSSPKTLGYRKRTLRFPRQR
jgi:hypothetical protein